MNRKKILFLTTRFPYPPIGGDKLKAYNLLKIVTKYYDVDLLAFSFRKYPEKRYIEQLESLESKVKVLKFNPFLGGLNCLWNIFTEKPFEVSFYHLKEFGAELKKRLEKTNYDVVIAFFMRAGEFVRNIPNKKILIAEDCRTIYQQRSFEQTRSLIQKPIRYHEWKKLQKYEPKMMDDFDLVSFVSKTDIEMMQKIHPTNKYRLLSNGTDIEKYKPNNSPNQNTILFAGKMNVHSNQISAQILAREVFPIVRSAITDARLILAGADMDNNVRKLAGKGIEIIDNIPDMSEIYTKAAIFVNVHKGGSGIQNKNIEAMASGCALVTTSTGNQGIEGENGTHLLIADTPEDFATKIIMLLKNNAFRHELATNGREHIANTHTWEHVEQQFLAIMGELLDE